MGYTITVSGNQPADDSSEARAFEERVRDAAREFVQSLDGVTGASAAFDTIPSVRLLDDEEADAGATQAATPAGEQAATEPAQGVVGPTAQPQGNTTTNPPQGA